MKMLISIAMSLLILSLGAITACSGSAALNRGYQVGNLAIDFELKSLDGQSVSLSSLRGKTILLNFWATWCPPCREEMPLFQQIFEDSRWKDKGLVILGMNLSESVATVTEFMKTNGLTFPILLDTGQDVARDYNIRGIPTTFFIDKNGIIREIRIGAFPNKAAIESVLNKIT